MRRSWLVYCTGDGYRQPSDVLCSIRKESGIEHSMVKSLNNGAVDLWIRWDKAPDRRLGYWKFTDVLRNIVQGRRHILSDNGDNR